MYVAIVLMPINFCKQKAPDDGSDEPKRVVRCRVAYLSCISTLHNTDEFQAANGVLENLDFEHQLRTKCQFFFAMNQVACTSTATH